MRTFSTTLASFLQRTDGAEFRVVLAFAPFTPPYTTTELPGYFASTAVFLIPTPDDPPGFTYVTDAAVLSVLGCDESVDRLGDVKVEMVDSALTLQQIHLKRRVAIYLRPVSGSYLLDPADIVFLGDIANPIDRAQGKITFDLASAGYAHNRTVRHLILQSAFPDIDPTLVGGNLPTIYGTVPKVPCVLENADINGFIGEDLSASATQVIAIFERAIPTSGYVRIGGELIGYTDWDGFRLKNLQRGFAPSISPPPSEHKGETEVVRVSQQLVFRLASHWVKSVTNVRYGGVSYGFSHNHAGPLLTVTPASNTLQPAKDLVADISGLEDDATGSITGTPYALIERPDHVVRHLLRTYGGATSAETRAEDFDAFTDEALGIYLPDEFRVFDVLAEIARQCSAVITYSGTRWIMRRQRVINMIASAGFTDASTLRNEDGTSSLAFSHRDISLISNRTLYRYGAIPDGSWVQIQEQEDLESQAVYGVRSATFDFSYFYMPGQAAQILSDLNNRRTGGFGSLVTLSTTIAKLAVEIGDTVTVAHSGFGLTFRGFVTSIKKDLTGRMFGVVQVGITGKIA
ncbi:hypothetical protein SIID45300_01742 [Candidatus Magnetaquicoccaceae bacterium FCR-1]|uniref:Uncharacterized protein n=1 Tax=Candidatus Magnetaquiglobus chichijimensis TaxID=3141448 RepID=A0ABQ0C952_9PROT